MIIKNVGKNTWMTSIRGQDLLYIKKNENK
jgi:hypothetical protein